jgi:hypothetical protein
MHISKFWFLQMDFRFCCMREFHSKWQANSLVVLVCFLVLRILLFSAEMEIPRMDTWSH